MAGNIFNPYFKRLIDCLAILNFENFVASRRLEALASSTADKLARARRESADPKLTVLGSSSVLNGNDPFSETPRRISYGAVGAHDDKIVDLIRETSARVRAQAMCVAFEEVEAMLREISRNFYFSQRKQISLPKKHDFHSWLNKTNRKVTKGLPEYYATYIECNCLPSHVGRSV